jgi:hypothetical protein
MDMYDDEPEDDAEVGIVPDLEEDEFDPLDPTKIPRGFGLDGAVEVVDEEEPEI